MGIRARRYADTLDWGDIAAETAKLYGLEGADPAPAG